MKAGWILIEPETDEFYGRVQWRDEDGKMTDKVEVIEQNFRNTGYCFCKAGLGELVLITK